MKAGKMYRINDGEGIKVGLIIHSDGGYMKIVGEQGEVFTMHESSCKEVDEVHEVENADFLKEVGMIHRKLIEIKEKENCLMMERVRINDQLKSKMAERRVV